jgi:hypothetical protein
MNAPHPFAASVAEIAQGLRDTPATFTSVNRAAALVDHLGRRLHGLGFVRHREIATCLMSAVVELQGSTGLPTSARNEAVARAIAQLEDALVFIGDGTTE